MTHPTHLDLATRAATAFESFAELQSACERDGYVPTLVSGDSDGVHHAWAVGVLRRGLETRGCAVWPVS